MPLVYCRQISPFAKFEIIEICLYLKVRDPEVPRQVSFESWVQHCHMLVHSLFFVTYIIVQMYFSLINWLISAMPYRFEPKHLCLLTRTESKRKQILAFLAKQCNFTECYKWRRRAKECFLGFGVFYVYYESIHWEILTPI